MNGAAVLPPHDLEAEQSVLGAVILADTVMSPLVLDERLLPEHFYREQHATIYRAMVQLYDAGRPIDVVTLSDHLDAGGHLAEVGGRAMVDALAGAAPAAGNAHAYARIVVNRATLRARLIAAQEIIASVYERDEDRFNRAEAQLATADRPDAETMTAEQLADEALEHLERIGDDPNAIKLPWSVLTRDLGGGLTKGDTTLVAGWTHHGKTCAIDGILETAALAGATVGVYSNEMGRGDWTLRMLASLSGVKFHDLRSRNLSADEMGRARAAASVLRRLAIKFTPCAGWTGHDVGRHIRRHRPDICALDIVNRVPHEGTRGLDEISLALNNAARQADSHLLIACHLNQARNTSERPPRPMLRDIRESGALANDANNVMFVHRETVERTTPAGVGTGIFELSGDGSIYFGKARNGMMGGVDVHLDPARMRFAERQAVPEW